MAPEDKEVLWAITEAGYQYKQDDFNLINSFVPTYILYAAYNAYIHRTTYREVDDTVPANLNPRQFGVSLCWVFSIAPEHHVRRKFHGKRKWGYLCWTGPEALITREVRGRRPVRIPPDEE